jgi:hypothetical protein
MASLLRNNPELAKEWHPSKNGLLTAQTKKSGGFAPRAMNGRPELLTETTARLDALTVLGTEFVSITAYTLLTQILPVSGTQRRTVL